MMLGCFNDVADVTGYQKLRAIIATLNNAGLLARPDANFRSHEDRAMFAIDAAEALLDQLGIVDPDTISG